MFVCLFFLFFFFIYFFSSNEYMISLEDNLFSFPIFVNTVTNDTSFFISRILTVSFFRRPFCVSVSLLGLCLPSSFLSTSLCFTRVCFLSYLPCYIDFCNCSFLSGAANFFFCFAWSFIFLWLCDQFSLLNPFLCLLLCTGSPLVQQLSADEMMPM